MGVPQARRKVRRPRSRLRTKGDMCDPKAAIGRRPLLAGLSRGTRSLKVAHHDVSVRKQKVHQCYPRHDGHHDTQETIG